MNRTLTLLALSLTAWLAPAHALEIMPYTAQALMGKQQAGEVVGLHFHAAWCPTLLVVDYDQERELKRELGVRSQSTLIVYKGKEQKHRSGGVTDAQALRGAWVSAQ